MPLEATELRISLQKLLIGMVLVIVPLSIIGVYITHRSERNLEQAVGAQHHSVAESLSTTINRFVSDRVIDCNVIASEQPVIEAIMASNKSYQGTSDAAIKERIDHRRSNWSGAGPDPALKTILESPASRTLRRHREVDPRFLRITVADQRGATVAATDKPADYLQSDEDYWPAVYAEGKGAVMVRKVLYDASSRSTYVGIAVPVLEEGTQQFAGSVYALVDVAGLLRQVARAQTGPATKIIIAKDDGTVVLAPGITLANNLKAEEHAAVRDALASAETRQTGYTLVDLRNGRRNIVGFADTGASSENLGLAMIVMVSQNIADAAAPVLSIGTFAWVMVVLALLMLTLTGVYVLLHRREDFEELEPLGENVPPQVRRSSAT